MENITESLPITWEQENGYQIFALVYQAGIANVFKVRSANLGTFGREAQRVYQGDFRGAENFVRGMLCGDPKALCFTAHCNRLGDIADAPWSGDLDAAPFSDKFHPVFRGFKPIA